MYMCIYIYIYSYIGMYNHAVITMFLFQGGVRNRSEPAEPNRTEPSRLILEPAGTGRGNKPNRPDRATRPKTQAEPHRTGKFNYPNRTESNRTD